MSHTETRREIDEWEVDVCDNCGHEEGQHYKKPTRLDVRPGEYYIMSGCMVRQHSGGRVLPGEPSPNRYPRCTCMEFK